MDPISRATLPNIIPATPRVGETAPLAPTTAVPASGAVAVKPILSSTEVDISPLGQFLSGVALSRRQLLALQGATEQASAANTPVNVNDDLLALARQLTESFAQLQTSGIDASQLATAGDTPGSLAQRYDLLAGDGTTGAAAALAQDGNLLTQAGLARIGIDLRNEDVDAPALQAAYAADRNATLDALQQGTDVLAQVGAVLAQRQGAPVASVVQADLIGETVTASAVAAAQAAQAAAPTAMSLDESAQASRAALGQRQLEVRQQMETEELSQDLQDVRPAAQDAAGLPSATAARIEREQAGDIQARQTQQAQQAQQTQQINAGLLRQQALQADSGQERTQAQRADSARIDAQRVDTDRIAGERQAGQQETARVEDLRQGELRQAQLQQSQLQEQAQVTADEAVRAQLAASDAQLAARAAAERAQSMARTEQLQADQGLAATAQAQLAQQNAQAQELAAQNAGMAVPLPSSQDPSVAAAIAAYNLNNAALNPGLMNRQLSASDLQKPLVTPVAPVEPVKPVNKIQGGGV